METPIKKFGTLNIIAAAFNICQAWASIGATFALSIEHGGSTTIIYGSIVIFLVYSAIALSLAELAARYPTAGGQYHWTAILAPEPFKRQLVSLLWLICKQNRELIAFGVRATPVDVSTILDGSC